MLSEIYKVTLMPEEREYLTALITEGKAAAQKAHARILPKADQSENVPAWKDENIREASDVSLPTIERVRKAFIGEGVEAAINHKKPCGTRPPKSDGEKRSSADCTGMFTATRWFRRPDIETAG